MNKKIALLLFGLFICGSTAWADRKGNGGGSIACIDGDQILSAQTLDLVEAHGREIVIKGEKYRLEISRTEKPFKEQLDEKIAFIKDFAPFGVFGGHHRGSLFSMVDKVVENLDHAKNAPESEYSDVIIGDFSSIQIPKDFCQGRGIAVYRNIFVYTDGDEHYFVNGVRVDDPTQVEGYGKDVAIMWPDHVIKYPAYFRALESATDVAAIYAHEIFYRYWRERGSDFAREITGVLFSNLPAQVKREYFIEQLGACSLDGSEEYIIDSRGMKVLNGENVGCFGAVISNEIAHEIERQDASALKKALERQVLVLGHWVTPAAAWNHEEMRNLTKNLWARAYRQRFDKRAPESIVSYANPLALALMVIEDREVTGEYYDLEVVKILIGMGIDPNKKILKQTTFDRRGRVLEIYDENAYEFLERMYPGKKRKERSELYQYFVELKGGPSE